MNNRITNQPAKSARMRTKAELMPLNIHNNIRAKKNLSVNYADDFFTPTELKVKASFFWIAAQRN